MKEIDALREAVDSLNRPHILKRSFGKVTISEEWYIEACIVLQVLHSALHEEDEERVSHLKVIK